MGMSPGKIQENLFSLIFTRPFDTRGKKVGENEQKWRKLFQS
jgi:hypothetical protein